VKPILVALAGLLAGGAAIGLAQGAASSQLEPGLWQVSSTVTSNGMAGDTVADRRCLAPAEAAKGAEAMLLSAGPDCTASHTTVANGKLDALFHCTAGTHPALTVAITGSFTAKSYEAVSKIDDGATTRTIKVTGKWVGACSS